MPSAGGRRRGRAPRAGLGGRARHKLSASEREACGRLACRGVGLRVELGRGCGRSDRRIPGALRRPRRQASCREAPARLQPARVAVGHDGRRSRARGAAGHPPARALRLDRPNERFASADLVIADTAAHARLLRGALRAIPREQRRGVFPRRRGTGSFGLAGVRRCVHVPLLGKLIPLHGLETILAAARLCPDIAFRIAGSGQLDERARDEASDERDVRPVGRARADSPELCRSAGCALGIFGASDESAPASYRTRPSRRSPARTPLVTADTPAARELLEDGRERTARTPGDPEALAVAITSTRRRS